MERSPKTTFRRCYDSIFFPSFEASCSTESASLCSDEPENLWSGESEYSCSGNPEKSWLGESDNLCSGELGKVLYTGESGNLCSDKSDDL